MAPASARRLCSESVALPSWLVLPRQPVLLALLAAILLGGCRSPQAADPQKEILDGLRAKGHYDEAIDYLQHARANPGTPKTFAETIDYELAVTRIDAAASLAETERDKPLQLAQEALTKFLADQPRHALAAAARVQLGNVLFDRGRLQRMLAGQYEGPARQKHLEAARGLLRQADEQWAGIDKAADEELKQIVFVRGDEIKRSEARDQIHRRQLQARLARAWVQYEMGQTYPAGSGERTAALQEAGKRFDTLYDQQRERLAGFYARLGRGLCCKDLGESEKAFAIFEELLGLPDDPADFHALRGKAAVQALETSLRPEVKKYKQGLDIAQRWIGGDRPQPLRRRRFRRGRSGHPFSRRRGGAGLCEDPAGRIARAKRIADPADRLGAAAVQHRGRRGRAVSGARPRSVCSIRR